MKRKSDTAHRRQGMILLVVLVILTLFAILGITFVLYSESVALAARYGSEGASLETPDMDPQECFALFISQLIYDVSDSDPSGQISALRGHSLGRNMYGWNSGAGVTGNITPFNGVGRLHFKYSQTIDPQAVPINAIDDWQLINYTTFTTLDNTLVRDPEYFGIKNPAWAGGHKYVGGLNPTYTYPDQNNLFLGAVRPSDGVVIAHSFHRDYTGFGVLSPTNPNWLWPSNPNSSGNYPTTTTGLPLAPVAYSATNPPNNSPAGGQHSGCATKYMVLRPRPADHNGFPLPEDAGGDVKNLPFSPGYYDATTSTQAFNDSFWMDIGAPVLTARDGRKYKMLVAPFIIDLDGKIDINAVGNVRGQPNTSATPNQNYTHMSNMGFGPWEINPFKVLNGSTDPSSLNAFGTPAIATWTNLFTGVGSLASAPPIQGRYGPAAKYSGGTGTNPTGLPYWIPQSGYSGSVVYQGRSPHYYSPVDFDGCKLYANPDTGTITYGQTSASIVAPTAKTPFPPAFSSAAGLLGYDSYSMNERTDHPLLYDVLNPYNDPSGPSFSSTSTPLIYNRRFKPAHLERLLRFGDTGYTSLPSDLERLSLENFNYYDWYNTTWDGTLPANASCQRRWMVTTNSADRIAPGLTPYIFDPTSSGYAYPATSPDYTLPAVGPSVSYPMLTYGTVPVSPPILGTTTFPGEFALTTATTSSVDYRAQSVLTWAGKLGDFSWQWPSGAQLQTALKRINLNRRLTPYPLYDSTLGSTPAWQNSQSGATFNTVMSSSSTAFAAAQADRQQFADEIYRRLLLVTGVPPSATPSSPSAAELAPRRALAQIAVNIVDFIDEDDIMTPFNFYNNQDDPSGGVSIYATDSPTTPGAPASTELPRYWVFGTEIPKVVLSEVSAQSENGIAGNNSPVGTTPFGPPFNVAIWVELQNVITQNTLPASAAGQIQDSFPVPLVAGDGTSAIYQIVVGAGGLYQDPTVGLNGNPLGICLYKRTATDPAADFVVGNAKLYQQKAAATAQPATTITSPTGSTPTALNGPYIGLNPYTVTGTQPALSVSLTAGTASVPNVPLSPYYIVGPLASSLTAGFFADPLETSATATPTVPTNTPMLQTSRMIYQTAAAGFGTPDDRTTGLTVLLRRLANPHLPPNPTPGAGWNPYVTIDYMDQVPILGTNGVADPTNGYLLQSRGKTQPYAGATQVSSPNTNDSPVYPLTLNSVTQNQQQPAGNTADSNGLLHTFGQVNNSSSAYNPTVYNWLVHLDRQVVSPVELLHVSGHSPALLTQKFVNVNSSTLAPYSHTAPWFDQNAPTGNSYRLYRLFEFLDAGNRGAGVAPDGRASGKINLNTVWDMRIFEALCDGNTSNHVGTPDTTNADVIWNAFVKGQPASGGTNFSFGRTPFSYPALPQDFDLTAVGTANLASYYQTGGLPSGTTPRYDRPLLGLGTGMTTGASGTQFPNNRGIDDTLFRSATVGVNTGRVFQLQSDYGSTVHPYLQYQLLNKIFNNVTTRSNVFGVWATVGFFQVTDATTTPPTLGAEIGKAEGRNIRHRMFAIVDRTNLAAFQSTSTTAIALTTQDASGPTGVDVNGGQAYYRATDITTVINTTDNRNSNTITIGAGMEFVFEPGTDNEETVVTYGTGAGGGTPFAAEFHKPHASGVTVIIRGNPGPWTRYDPRQDTNVVLHWNIIN